jgi:photosystem II stability/assembly factor-like uncharacterized protein
MRARFLLAAGLLVAALLTGVIAGHTSRSAGSTRTHAQLALRASGEAGREGENEARELEEPSDAILARNLFGADKRVDPARYFARAAATAAALGQQTAATDPAAAGAAWQPLGPSNIGGRVLDIVVDPNNADTIYIAAATGGVWKSTDKGLTFTSVWPDDLTQTIGALAIAPDGTLYAGTGEAGPGGGSSTYGGDGVYKSTDGGQTWQSIGLSETNRIGRIVVDPKNPQRIFVAGTGPLYKHGGGRGLYLSEDGGSSWTKILSGDNDTTGAVDIAIDPRDSKTVYAAMWDNFREWDRRTYEGLGSGLYKSIDGGKTWARIGTPFFGPRPDLGRIGVAVAPDGTVYANASGASGVYSGFYMSKDGGVTWSTGQPPANPEDSFYVYGWWFGRIYVDPKDSNHVYQAALVLQESNDGGQSWHNAPGGCSNICTGGHADQHAMAFDPKVPGRLYLGNDGGVFRSDDNGQNWSRFESLPISQVNGMDVSQQDPTRIAVGLQDNGSNRNWKRTTDTGAAAFNSFNGGDGQRVNIGPHHQNIVFSCYQYGECSTSNDGGSTNNTMGVATPETGAPPGTRWNWFTPIEFDPSDKTDSTIYSGSEILSVSHDDGANFTPISPDLTNGPGRETNPLFRNFGTITTVAPATDGKTVYVGTDDGNLWYTHDASSPANWTKATDSDLPKAWVTRVFADPANPNVAYAAYSGFRQGDNAPYLVKTTDGGATWSNVSDNLPQAPISDVKLVGNTVVVATDVGVFFRRPADTGWLRLGTGLPLAPAYELRYTPRSGELFVGTFGRGVYKIDASILSS